MSQTHPYVHTPPSEEPPTKVVALALLMTRCGCERTIEIPANLPRTITIELAPLDTGDKHVEERIFYLKAKGSHPSAKGDIYLYQEGPAREKSLITVPGVTPHPKRLR